MIDLNTFRLKLKYGDIDHGGTHLDILWEMIKYPKETLPLLPEIIGLHREGRLYAAESQLIEYWLLTGDKSLQQLLQDCGGFSRAGLCEKCTLLERNIPGIEDDLLRELWKTRKNSEEPFRRLITESLGKYGTEASLSFLTGIYPEHAESAMEQRVKLESDIEELDLRQECVEEGGADKDKFEFFGRSFAVEADIQFVEAIRQAVGALRERGIGKPSESE